METSKLTTMIMGNFILKLLQLFIVESKFIEIFFLPIFTFLRFFCGNKKNIQVYLPPAGKRKHLNTAWPTSSYFKLSASSVGL